MAVRVAPITAADIPATARFLHDNLNSRVTVDAWERAVQVPWKVAAPNHGFLLRDTDGDGRIVGAYLAFYSERTIGGQVRRFCNLGAWCVLPDYRFHSLKLLKALLGQEGYVFTDLSPSGNVVPMNTRLGFTFLDTATAVAPNLPWLPLPGGGRVTTDPADIEDILTGADLQIYRDHATTPARHVVLTRGDRRCYVVFRTDRRKDLPFFASVLYVSDQDLFRAMSRRFRSHLLLRHGVLVTLAELRVVGHRPPLSRMLGNPRRKMFRDGSGLQDRDIDYLYSELTCLSW